MGSMREILSRNSPHEPPFQRGRQTNLLTPHPGPLPFEGRGRIAGRFMVPMRAENGVGAPHEPPFQRGRLTNLLTPHPGPLPFEGRGRIGSPVHGLNARNLVWRNSLPGPLLPRWEERENSAACLVVVSRCALRPPGHNQTAGIVGHATAN